MSKRKWYTRPLYLVFALALCALALPAAVVASPDVSNVRVELSDYGDAATSVTYYIYFTPGVDLTKNVDTITVRFPAGTTGIASGNAARVDQDGDAVLYDTTGVSLKSATAQRFIMTTPVNITAGTEVRVEIDSITNPTFTGTTKAYTLKVCTSQETTEVESSPYTIGVTEVTGVNFTPAPTTAGSTSVYTIDFTSSSSGALTSGLDSVTVIFPPGTTVPDPITAADIEFTGDAGPTDCSVVIVSGNAVTLTVPEALSASTAGQIVFGVPAAKKMIKNGTLATNADPPNDGVNKGSYIGKVYTSKDLGVERDGSAYTIDPNSPSALKFYSKSPSSVTVGVASGTIKVRSTDQYGNMVDAHGTADVKVNLSSNSTTGLFRGDNEDDADGDGDIDSSDADWTSTNPCTYFNGGAYEALLIYKDTTLGTARITASSPYGWTSDTWDIDVVAKSVELWDGPLLVGTYGTIAAAEAEALPYNTIKVGPRTYTFASTLAIDVPNLTIESTGGAAATIIDAATNGVSPAITISAADVTVDGFTVKHGTLPGIQISGVDATVQNNIVTATSNSRGITVSSTGATISGNELDINSTMYLGSGASADCTLSDNTFGAGIDLKEADKSNITITDNIIIGSEYNGITLKEGSFSDILIKGNTISGTILGEGTGINVHTSAVNVTGLIITGNDITDNEHIGILIQNTGSLTGNAIMFNNITGNADYGIKNTTSNNVAADHNWWGDASGPTVSTNPAGTGDKVSATHLNYDYWLGASVSAADYVASASSLNAQSTVGVKVTSSLATTKIGVAKYTGNPQGTPDEFTPLDFFDVYASEAAGSWGTSGVVTIKLYNAGVTSDSKVYFWDTGEDAWVECYEKGTASGYAWARVRPYSLTYPERVPVLTDLVGLPFAISTEAVPTIPWDLRYGLDADPAAVNIWTYPADGVTVTLADVETTMPEGLLIWHYSLTDGWRFYKKGWGVSNTLTTLVPGDGYIGIVPTASVWEIPQA